MIQEETSSAIWRHVPSQSNPADLILRRSEPSAPTSTPWGKGPQVITEAIKLAYNGVQHSNRKTGIQTCALHFCILQKTLHNDSPSPTNSPESLHTAKDSTTANIPRPTSNQPLCPHKLLTRL
jgi:hypothetical protein